MATVVTTPAPPGARSRASRRRRHREAPRFPLPSAYTILFALIVITALATWIIPAGRYALDADGSPIPGTYEEVDVEPGADPRRLAQGADQRPVRHRGPRHEERRLLQRGLALRRHRRRPVHPRHRRLHRDHDEDRRHPGRHRPARGQAPRSRALDDPDPHDRLRHRRHDVRDGRGEPRLLRPHRHGDDRRRLRRRSRARRSSCSAPASASSARPSTRSPPASRPTSPTSALDDGLGLRLVLLVVGLAIGIWFVMRYAERVRKDPTKSLVYAMKADNEAHFKAASDEARRGRAHRPAQADPRRLRPRLPRDDLRRHPVGGHRHRASPRCGGGSRR